MENCFDDECNFQGTFPLRSSQLQQHRTVPIPLNKLLKDNWNDSAHKRWPNSTIEFIDSSNTSSLHCNLQMEALAEYHMKFWMGVWMEIPSPKENQQRQSRVNYLRFRDNFSLQSNFINALLVKFKTPSFELYNKSGDSDHCIQKLWVCLCPSHLDDIKLPLNYIKPIKSF